MVRLVKKQMAKMVDVVKMAKMVDVVKTVKMGWMVKMVKGEARVRKEGKLKY